MGGMLAFNIGNIHNIITSSTFIGNTSSTISPTLSGSVTTGTTNGSPFGTSVNSYQIATQPSSSPYNYISVPGSSAFAFGTGDFTIEWFQYETVAASYPRLFWYTSTAGASYPTMGMSLEGTAYFWNSPSGLTAMGSHGTLLSTWIHFAIVRISSKLYFYKNGTLISTSGGITNTTNFTDTSSTFYIGTKSNGGMQSEQFSGSITSFRVCNGLGVYTGNFTKPTSKLGQTASANPYGGANTAAITSQCTLLLNP
jgi:Concanavalin A-like lectin/glucanases superfamily